MSRSERIEAALKRVPAHLTGELKDAFLGLISPTSIGITVAAFAGLAVAQFFGYGEAADAVLAAIAYGIAGLSGVRALYDMVAGDGECRDRDHRRRDRCGGVAPGQRLRGAGDGVPDHLRYTRSPESGAVAGGSSCTSSQGHAPSTERWTIDRSAATGSWSPER